MKVIKGMLVDVLIAACIYGWKVLEMHSAKVFLEAWLWFVVVMQLIFIMLAEQQHLYRRSKVHMLYDVASTIVVTGALLWLGETMLAITLFFSWIFVCAKLEGYEKEPA